MIVVDLKANVTKCKSHNILLTFLNFDIMYVYIPSLTILSQNYQVCFCEENSCNKCLLIE